MSEDLFLHTFCQVYICKLTYNGNLILFIKISVTSFLTIIPFHLPALEFGIQDYIIATYFADIYIYILYVPLKTDHFM